MMRLQLRTALTEIRTKMHVGTLKLLWTTLQVKLGQFNWILTHGILLSKLMTFPQSANTRYKSMLYSRMASQSYQLRHLRL